MRLPVAPAATALAASKTLLVTTNQRIMLAEYDGSNFTTKMDAAVAGVPSWVEFREPNLLYGPDEWGNGMYLWNLDVAAGTLSEPVAQATGSSGVVHMQFTPDGSRMVAPAYGAGAIDVYDTSDNQLKLLKTIPSTGKTGSHPQQTQAHPHQTVLDPTGRFFLVNDLGTDEILVIDSKDDAFAQTSAHKLEHDGCGPRHGAFFGEDHYMVLCEMGNVVVVLAVEYTDAEGIKFTQQAEYSTYADGAAPEGAAGGELVLADNMVDLYVSNRITGGDTDSIVNFKAMPDATLKFAGSTSTGGRRPRMFSMGKDGSELFVGNQDGDLALVAVSRQSDGSLADAFAASWAGDVFGGPSEMLGPQYVKQIA